MIKPGAPLESLDPADILRTLFQTRPGDPSKMAPTKLTANLTPFAGQTVRLRIATAVHEEVLNAGVDAVSISATPPGRSPSGGSNRLSLGKAKAIRRKGIVILPVQVPGPGLLSAKGKGTGAPKAGKRARPGRGLGKAIKFDDRQGRQGGHGADAPQADPDSSQDPDAGAQAPGHGDGDLQAGRRLAGNSLSVDRLQASGTPRQAALIASRASWPLCPRNFISPILPVYKPLFRSASGLAVTSHSRKEWER